MTELVLTGAGTVRPAVGAQACDGWFDPVPVLGRRGWKYLTPATRYVLAAATLTLADAKLAPEELPPESMGVVIGTNFAAEPVVDRLDQIVRSEGASMLSPAEAPNFSVNIAASNISMRYGMRAFNLTLTNPIVAGLESILTLAAAIRRGRAQLGLAGATEERPSLASDASEGACCLAVETAVGAAARSAPVKARILGGFSRFGFSAVDGPLRELFRGWAGLMPYTLVGPEPIAAQAADRLAHVAEEAGIELERRWYSGAAEQFAAVSPLLQLTGLLAAGTGGVVLAVSPHGHVAALRIGA